MKYKLEEPVRSQFLKYLNKLIQKCTGKRKQRYNQLIAIRNAVIQNREIYNLPKRIEKELKFIKTGKVEPQEKYRKFDGFRTTMGTAWGIRRGKLPKDELKVLREKYDKILREKSEPIKIEEPPPRFRRRPKNEIHQS